MKLKWNSQLNVLKWDLKTQLGLIIFPPKARKWTTKLLTNSCLSLSDFLLEQQSPSQTQTYSLCMKRLCFRVLMLWKQKNKTKTDLSIKNMKNMFMVAPTQTMKGSLLMATIWMLTTAAAIVRFRWKRREERTDADECVCVSGSFHWRAATERKKNTKEITCSSAAAQTKGTKQRECVCVCVS